MDRGAIPTYDRLMTKTILMAAAVLVTGCADDDDKSYLKAEIECGDSWLSLTPEDNYAGASCDAACDPKPDQGLAACDTTLRYTPLGSSEQINFPCLSTFEIDGVRGCCASLGRPAMIKPGNAEPARTRSMFFLTCQ